MILQNIFIFTFLGKDSPGFNDDTVIKECYECYQVTSNPLDTDYHKCKPGEPHEQHRRTLIRVIISHHSAPRNR